MRTSTPRTATGLAALALALLALGGCAAPRAADPGLDPDPAPVPAPAPDPAPDPAPGDSIVPAAVPYTLEYVPRRLPGLPGLHSYVWAAPFEGALLVVGGRRGQGLHSFFPDPLPNFPRDSTNHHFWVIDPAAGRVDSLDVDLLPPELATPLKGSNAQGYYDRADSLLYIAGGYGWNDDGSDMETFGTLLAVPAAEVVRIIRGAGTDTDKASRIADSIRLLRDDRMAVTGGELVRMAGTFYLVFGQRFDGQYRPFGTGDFDQEYTEAVRVFTLDPNALRILSYGEESRKNDPRHPFHRRDLNIIEDIDPVTGSPRITALGGVFPPGIIGGYDTPIYIDGPGSIREDTAIHQAFSQYTAPTVVVYDSAASAVYRTLFGGISHHYYHRTAAQDSIYRLARAQGRDDGLPFSADISTFILRARPGGPEASHWGEYIMTDPVPDTALLAASVPFMLSPEMLRRNMAYENGVVALNRIAPGHGWTVGWIVGGIRANYPLPLIPNFGTCASDLVFEVRLTRTPSAGIPTRYAREAAEYRPHGSVSRSAEVGSGGPVGSDAAGAGRSAGSASAGFAATPCPQPQP